MHLLCGSLISLHVLDYTGEDHNDCGREVAQHLSSLELIRDIFRSVQDDAISLINNKHNSPITPCAHMFLCSGHLFLENKRVIFLVTYDTAFAWYLGAIVVQEVEESFSNRKVASSIPTPPHQVSKCP